MTLDVAVAPSETTVTVNESGDYDIEMTFKGDVGGSAVAALVDHVDVTLSCTASPDMTQISNLQGDMSVLALFGIEVFSTSMGLDSAVDLEQLF